MADIKTRDAVKGTIKTIDKAAIATERMKSAYAKTKDKAEQGYYADESSATEYAADRLSYGADRIKDEGIHQFNKQGQKAVKETRENIGKAKDKISSYKQKKAAKAAEQNNTACRSVTGLQAVPLLPIAPKGQNLSLSRPDSKAKRRLRPPPEMLKRRSRQPQKVRSKPPRKALRLHRLPLRRLSKQPSIPPKQRRQRQRLRQKRLKGLHRQQKPLPRLRLRR